MNHKHLTRQNLKAAPEELSTYQKQFPAIPLDVHQYRLLGEDNQPILATFLESQPADVFLEDFAANQDTMMPGAPPAEDSIAIGKAFAYYRLFHGVQLRGPGYKLLGQDRMGADLVVDPETETPSSTVFTVPYGGESTRQVFYAELHNRAPGTKPKIETPFPDHLRGLGKRTVIQPEPLNTDRSQLEMGDLILGYQMKDTPSEESLFPFVVANDRKIPDGEDLAVHAEVYHLQQDPDGIARFQLQYEIKPKNFLGWTKEKAEAVSLTLNLETDRPRWSEDLQIKTRRLDPGKYVLRMEATAGSQQVKREINFEVVESKD